MDDGSGSQRQSGTGAARHIGTSRAEEQPSKGNVLPSEKTKVARRRQCGGASGALLERFEAGGYRGRLVGGHVL